MKKFTPLVLCTVFYTCSMPLNLDTYRYCPYQCIYCFMRNRVVGKRDEHIPPNLHWLQHKFQKVYDKKDVDRSNFMEVLLKNRVDLHCGTKSEPFSPLEPKYNYTRQAIEICNEYDQNIVFTTKSDTTYDIPLNPEHHSIQLSITNHTNNKQLEPNIPDIEERINFYNKLKDEGYHVGLRVEPYIPGISDIPKIMDLFTDVEYIHLSRLMLLPQTDNTELLKIIKADPRDYTTMGYTTMKDEILYHHLEPVFEYLNDSGVQWNSRFMLMGNQDCCCGDTLIHKSTNWDTLHLKRRLGPTYTMEEGLEEIGEYRDCRCEMLYTSNRRGDNKTIEDFYRDRWDNHNCKFNPQNWYKPLKTLESWR